MGNRATAPRTYRRREPEHGALHRTVREHLETFLAEERAKDPDGDGVPRFVADELRANLTCGVLAHGLARLRSCVRAPVPAAQRASTRHVSTKWGVSARQRV